MDYDEMLEYIIVGSRELDEAVEAIVKLNGNGTLFRVAGPPVPITKSKNGFVVANTESRLTVPSRAR